jgi:GTP cyclohydrolase FolE2
MGRKEKVLEWMKQNFGEATARILKDLDEEACVSQARSKVKGFLGNKKAEEFDAFVG